MGMLKLNGDPYNWEEEEKLSQEIAQEYRHLSYESQLVFSYVYERGVWANAMCLSYVDK